MNYGDNFNSELIASSFSATSNGTGGDLETAPGASGSLYVSDYNQPNFIPLAISFVLGIIIGVLFVILFRPKK